MSAFPIHDPQFWIASVIFLFALAVLLRGFAPMLLRGRGGRGGGGGGRRRRVKLTISARPRGGEKA